MQRNRHCSFDDDSDYGADEDDDYNCDDDVAGTALLSKQ